MAIEQKRQFGRREVNYHAWIKIAGCPELPCMVMDLSIKGARLEFDSDHRLPTVFRLIVPSIGFESDVTLRYQSQGRVGVQFVAPRETSADGVQNRERLKLPVERKPRVYDEPAVKEYSSMATAKARGILRG